MSCRAAASNRLPTPDDGRPFTPFYSIGARLRIDTMGRKDALEIPPVEPQ
ncbi:hypothetical protein ACV229_01395 [Burkholderia sp. MR1-5-21]